MDLQQLAQLLNTTAPTLEQQKKLEIVSNHQDRIFCVPQQNTPVCVICSEFSLQLERAACGCIICRRCLYQELPAIPVTLCPFCRKDVYPSSREDEIQSLIAQQILLCRFHESISPYKSTCQFVTSDPVKLFEHMAVCDYRLKTNEDASLPLQIPKSQIFSNECTLHYQPHFVSQSCQNIFLNLLQDAQEVAPSKNQIVPHLLVKQFYLQQQPVEISNFQLILFKNPADSKDLRQFSEISAGLQVSMPDGTQKNFEFWVEASQILNGPLRFSGCIQTTQPGRYVFDARVCLTFKSGGSVTSKKIIQRCVGPCVLNVNIEDLCKFEHDAASLFQAGMQMGCDIVNRGLELFRKQEDSEHSDLVSNSTQDELNVIDLNALLTFGGISTTIRDSVLFFIVLTQFSKIQQNNKLFSSPSCLEVVCQVMDKFQIYVVQKAAIEFLLQLVKSGADMNAVSTKSSGIFGRIRRIKVEFAEEKDVDELMEALMAK
ncbi:Conserved_hypothetical protein [Hexamita inflata]|uniref:RING-type domain-containing protein n=1 Tax=Hexamita inflata TaxID=28002 RepID=A0AA86TN35_9EUKA|nr:Conserved hypothetical protein [Hexamita inflata]CAI9938932.1 Conserved hypothetical protein [Hexamita inflata]